MHIHVSKLDAAKRQLEMAMQLFFRAGDPISIHTLAGAAHEVLETLLSKQGVDSMKKSMIAQVKPEYQDEFKKIINSPKNFFKHADRDSDGVIKFDPETSNFILWDASRMYVNLTSEYTPLFKVFDLWMYANDPRLYILSPEAKYAYDFVTKGLDPKNRMEFMKLLPDLEQIHYSS